jgi:hypothetical protein
MDCRFRHETGRKAKRGGLRPTREHFMALFPSIVQSNPTMSEAANERSIAPQESEERPSSTLTSAANSSRGDGTSSNANAAVGTATVTITETETQESTEVLRLTLRPRPTVRW